MSDDWFGTGKGSAFWLKLIQKSCVLPSETGNAPDSLLFFEHDLTKGGVRWGGGQLINRFTFRICPVCDRRVFRSFFHAGVVPHASISRSFKFRKVAKLIGY